MSNEISLTVPYQASALVRAAQYLQGLADDLGGAVEAAPELASHVAEPGNDNAGTATGQDGGHSDQNSAGAGDASKVDCKGVAFDPNFCGVASDPFYGSGKREGQWKKKRGLSEEEYDEWYAGQLAAAPQKEAPPSDPAPVNPGAAFAGQRNNPPVNNGPQDTGAFMGWISEKQTAGLLTQDDVQAAYAQAGVQVTDLFPPNDGAAIAEKLGALYGILSQKAGA